MLQQKDTDFKSIWKNHRTNVLMLALIWLAVVWLVDPRGEFTINDDWSYAHNVQSLYEEGKLHFSSWPAMTLIGQTIPAWFWSEMTGFSFTSLRVLTLLIALGGLVLVYVLKRTQ